MDRFLVREAESVGRSLGEVPREVQKRGEEEPGEERAGNQRELEGQEWRRKSVGLDVGYTQDSDLHRSTWQTSHIYNP